MAKYYCPVILTISGHIEIEAENIMGAQYLAREAFNKGVAISAIIDQSEDLEVLINEINLCE